MKKIILLLLLGTSVTACIDKDYDLKNVDTDDVTIGDENSVYELPLAKVNISMSQISDGTTQINDIFDEADIWLPTAVTEVDVEKLTGNAAYRNGLIAQTVTEMKSPQGTNKLNAVIKHTWDNYRQEFAGLVGSPASFTDYTSAFKTALASNSAMLETQINNVAARYLQKIDVEELSYDIDNVDVGSDIIDMLVKNLDPEGAANPKNTLHIYGSIFSGLPVSVRLDPVIVVSRNIGFTVSTVLDQSVDIPDTRIFESDLREILAGTTIRIPVTLLKYYPKEDFDAEQKINIRLSLRKKGGLNLNF